MHITNTTMILKTYQQALENIRKITEINSLDFRGVMLSSKSEALPYGVMLPDNLIAEMESFTERNSIVSIEAQVGKSRAELNRCCPRCLKAHALKTGKEIGLDKLSLSFISGLFECELGHEGYYLDGDSLVKI